MAKRSSGNPSRGPLTCLTPSCCEGISTAPIMIVFFLQEGAPIWWGWWLLCSGAYALQHWSLLWISVAQVRKQIVHKCGSLFKFVQKSEAHAETWTGQQETRISQEQSVRFFISQEIVSQTTKQEMGGYFCTRQMPDNKADISKAALSAPSSKGCTRPCQWGMFEGKTWLLSKGCWCRHPPEHVQTLKVRVLAKCDSQKNRNVALIHI